MPVCRLFFGLVNSRPPARFESSSLFAAVLLSGRTLAVVQSGDGTAGVAETTKSRPVEKFIGPPGQTHPSWQARLECSVPVPFVLPSLLCGAGGRGSQLSRTQKEMWVGRGEFFIVFPPGDKSSGASHLTARVCSLVRPAASLLASRAKESYQVSA